MYIESGFTILYINYENPESTYVIFQKYHNGIYYLNVYFM